MSNTLKPWRQTLPDQILHQYALMFEHPDARNMHYLEQFKAQCIAQEYYTYLAQLASLEVKYAVSIPIVEIEA
jgi:hypothetical protein